MEKLRKLQVFLKPFRKPLLLATALTVVLTFIGMAPPMLMRRLINDVAKAENWGIFPLIVTLLFAVPVFRAIVNAFNAMALNRAGQGIIVKTRKRLFRHILSLSWEFFNRTPVAHLNQRIMGDVGTVAGIAGGGLIAVVADVVAVVIAVVLMIKLSWTLSLVTFALLPLYYLNYRFFSGRIQQSTALLRTSMDHVSGSLQERLSAHELVQAYGQEKASATQFSSDAKQIMDTAVRGSVYSISFNQVAAFINKLGNVVIYGLGCYFFVKGRLEYGDVVAFCAYATQLLGPVVRFSQLANQLVQAGVSVDRLNEVFREQPAVTEPENAQPVTELAGDIKVTGVHFGYDRDEPVLQDLNLSVAAGTHIAVVGPAGAGRSTLAMLLRRFDDPTAGRIEVDGHDVRNYVLRDYRLALALVQTESAVFDGSLRENLSYGKPDAADGDILAAVKGVGLDALVDQLDGGLDTKVGSGGLVLSAGDQQRVGIARALVSEPMVLILDDATASLDAVSAERVMAAVRQAMAGKTCLLMVPRLLLARDADSVAVMEDGNVVEEGSHQELLAEESLYRQIYAVQYGDDRLPPLAGGPE